MLIPDISGSVVTLGKSEKGWEYADVQLGDNVSRIGLAKGAAIQPGLSLKGDHSLTLELGSYKAELTVRLAGARDRAAAAKAA